MAMSPKRFLFWLLLLWSLVPCRVQVHIQHLRPSAGGGGSTSSLAPNVHGAEGAEGKFFSDDNAVVVERDSNRRRLDSI